MMKMCIQFILRPGFEYGVIVGIGSPKAKLLLTRLRRENRQLKLEREILSKAAAWFARETATLPACSAS